MLGVTLNMVDLNRRRHHGDPSASYKDYRKYYQMEEKPSLFNWNNKRKPNGKSPKSNVAVQVPPAKATGRGKPVDRISAE